MRRNCLPSSLSALLALILLAGAGAAAPVADDERVAPACNDGDDDADDDVDDDDIADDDVDDDDTSDDDVMDGEDSDDEDEEDDD